MRRRRSIAFSEARRFRKPLLAYDGSPTADRALNAAIELVAGAHGRLTILSAVVHIPYLAYTGAAPEAVAEVRKTCLGDVERVLCRAVDRIPKGISVTKITSSQPIEQALLRQACEGDHDLVILGSRGRGPIRSLLLGSLDRTMLRRSPVPVLIVPPRAGEAPLTDQAGAQISSMTPRQV